GWMSGLGLVPGAWLVAGIASTFLPDPESSFSWALLGGLVFVAGLIGYGAVRIPGFRRGALLGSAISLTVAAALVGLILLLAP
ncbi:MAG: hypothetical protein OEO77_15850, partial [Acidimicrobiia bacterium]|nr:hypothetical protein [Acidimicrobiia bacterium]